MPQVYLGIRLFLLLILILLTTSVKAQDMLPYQDSTMPVAARVEDLLTRMTLDEKIGQMTLVSKDSIRPDDITDLGIGALLSGGGQSPPRNSPPAWFSMVSGFQERALDSRLGIPLLYGIDAIHGHASVRGAVVFPHNIGLGATGDAALVEDICRVTADEMAATGIYWNFGPVVAVAQDIRWGRTYESYSENADLVTSLSSACLHGLQGDDLADARTVLATPKHFVGDGGAVWGTSTTFNMNTLYQIDQGVTDVDEATLRAIHLPPYSAAIDNGARSMMTSFSSWGGLKMHAQEYLMTDVLKDEFGYKGFIVSDWAGIDQILGSYSMAVIIAINAGIDMNMVPNDYKRFIDALYDAVEDGEVSQERIDDAVRRILTIKFELGLFEHPFGDESLLDDVGSESHRELARQAVRQSLVLLKNDDVLPIATDTATIFVGGTAANDIGLQSGGWTLSWQGQTGNITPGSTILDGIEAVVSPDTRVEFNRFGRFDQFEDDDGQPLMADVGIVVIAEPPYAEGVGDRADLTLPISDLDLIDRMFDHSERVVVVLLSGRPLVVTDELEDWDAFVAAWLPGTEGAAVTDVLFGSHPFTGTLPFTWPRSNDALPVNSNMTGIDDDILFPFGFGLTG